MLPLNPSHRRYWANHMLAEYLSTYNLYSSIKYFIPIAVKFIISNHKNSSWHLWFAITSVTYFTPSFVKLILEMFNFVSWQLSLSIAFARCRAPSLPMLFLEISNSLVLPSLTSCASCAHPRGPMLLFDTSIGLPLSNAYRKTQELHSHYQLIPGKIKQF